MIYIGLGSNLGDPVANLKRAAALLEARGLRIVQTSSFYRTAPWGIKDQPDFMNAVVEISTSLNPWQVVRLALEAEMKMGRIRGEKWGPRVIDLDLLAYGNHFLRASELDLPHPRIAERAFVLAPWREIAPDFRLPCGKSNIAELYAALNAGAKSEAKKLPPI